MNRWIVVRLSAVFLVSMMVGLMVVPSAEAQEEPIKIGMITPLTSPLAPGGREYRDGAQMWFEQHGWEINGRSVELIVEDNAADAETALNKARSLVQRDDVDMILSPFPSHTTLAILDYAEESGTPVLGAMCLADNVTQREISPNFLRIAQATASQTTHPLGEWAAEQGYENVVTLSVDNVFGHSMTGGFVNTFTDNGGEVLDQMWHPIGVPDFSSFLAQIASMEPDLVLKTGVGGQDSVKFIRQWNDFGLKGEIPLVTNVTTVEQPVLRQVGEKAEGIRSSGHWLVGRQDPATQDFVEAWNEEHGQLPSWYAAIGYTAAKWTTLAVQDIPEDQLSETLEDVDALFDHFRQASPENSPMGPMNLDEYGNPIMNVYLREVQQRSDGQWWNAHVRTWEDVSQFWTYDAEDYLEQPTYSRDFQGIE